MVTLSQFMRGQCVQYWTPGGVKQFAQFRPDEVAARAGLNVGTYVMWDGRGVLLRTLTVGESMARSMFNAQNNPTACEPPRNLILED